MAQTYKFTVSMPVSTALARDRVTNTFHMEHITGGLFDTDLEAICQDIAAMYQARYGHADKEIQVKAYDTDAVPNYPRADVVVNPGAIWTNNHPREVALCLSFAGSHRGRARERGRLYLCPFLQTTITIDFERPNDPLLDWALAFYTTANQSFPDLGGVDWKFGIYSRVEKKFTQAQQAWVNDEWDTQRRRGLRESKRVTATREG